MSHPGRTPSPTINPITQTTTTYNTPPPLTRSTPKPSTSRTDSNSDFSTTDRECVSSSVWSTGLMSEPRAESHPSQFYFGPQPGLSFAIQGDKCQSTARDDFVSSAWNDRNSAFFGSDFNRDSSVSGPYTDPSPAPKSQFDWATKHPTSRKSSASSSTTSDSSGFSPRTGTSSLSSSWSEDQVPTLKRLGRPQLVGEDPALAAARRALWDEDPPAVTTTTSHSLFGTPTESEASQLGNSSDESDADSFDDDEPVSHRNARLFSLPHAPYQPKHQSRPQLVSCLRTSSSTSFQSALSLSPSLASTASSVCSLPLTSASSSSSLSVQFSDSPPDTLVTYSKHDYVRRGDAAVEKLSVRDWIELRDVKSVAVWSGKVAKWDHAPELTDAAIEHPQSPTSRPVTIDTLIDIQASELTTPTKLTLSEKRGQGANLVLDQVRSMDTELLVRPHYSPSVHSTTHWTQQD